MARLGRGHRFSRVRARRGRSRAGRASRSRRTRSPLTSATRRRGGWPCALFRVQPWAPFLPKIFPLAVSASVTSRPLAKPVRKMRLADNTGAETGADFGLPSEVVAGRLDRWLAVLARPEPLGPRC